MLATNVLRHSAKQAQRNGRFDSLVAIDARCYAFDDAFPNAIVTRQCTDLLLVIFREPECRIRVIALRNMVRL